MIDFENVNYISRYRYDESPELKLQVNDVLLAKDGNTLGITNIIRQLPKPATVNGSIAVLRAFDIEPRFLRYCLASSSTQDLINAIKDGMGVPHLFQWDIKRLPITIPPLDEQRRIADFLDVETAQIDELVSLRNKQVNALSEALLSEATRCTGRHRLSLEEQQMEWRRVQLRRVVDAVRTGMTPSEFLQVNANYDHIPWYTPAALDNALNLGKADKGVHVADVRHVPRFPAGSILIVGIGESLGKVAALDHEATGNQQLTAITTSNAVDRRFLLWQLFAAHEELRNWAQYSRVRILNNDVLKSFTISIPAVAQQLVLRKELDCRLAEFRAFRVAAERFSRLASERRGSLITAAVTGQIDVTSARRLSSSGGATS
ncbi:restriction endonuclease subunit S [Actinomadura syzygii]|uniref:restriction endonuclease subunit S n=1 Tax=Actinomadura syzygii TaxID=1427538 RepID=UPI001CA36E00|nr:restriction endonuclease subunit S [Actinomadura syzygii]